MSASDIPGTRWDRVEQETTETMQFTPSGVRGTRHADQSITFVRKVACSHLDFVWGTKAFRISHNVEVPCDMVTEDVAWVRNRRRKSFFYKYFKEDWLPGVPTIEAVRTEDFKYIRYPEIDAIEELYDLKRDPFERRNLAGESAAQDTLARMRAEIERLIPETRPTGAGALEL